MVLGCIFHSHPFLHDKDDHDKDAHFAHEDPDTPETPQAPPTPLNSPSSPSRVRHFPTSMASPEQVTSSSAIPIDGLFSEPESPKSRASSINSNSGQSRQKNKLSAISDKGKNYISSQNIHPKSLRGHFYPALVLQNSGSVARDHLASERTFLAYVRTSIGLAGAGVALVQLFTISDLTSKSTGVPLPAVNRRVQMFAAPLGLSSIGMALIVLLIGVFRYFLVQHALPENKFPASRLPIVFISFGLGAIMAIAFGALMDGGLMKVNHPRAVIIHT